MKLKVIRVLNKRLNTISIITFIFGALSITWTVQLTSVIWYSITIVSITIGLLCLTISWAIIKWKTIVININEVEGLIINTGSKISELKDHNQIQYLGNWLSLKSGAIYDIERSQILEIIDKIEMNKIEIKRTEQKFYNISPKELLKVLIELGR